MIPDLVIGGVALDWEDLSGVRPPDVSSYVVTTASGGSTRSGREARDGFVAHLVKHGDLPAEARQIADKAAYTSDRRRR